MPFPLSYTSNASMHHLPINQLLIKLLEDEAPPLTLLLLTLISPSPHNPLHPPSLQPPNPLPKPLHLRPTIQRPTLMPLQTTHHLLPCLTNLLIQLLQLQHLISRFEFLLQGGDLRGYGLAAELAELVACGGFAGGCGVGGWGGVFGGEFGGEFF